MVAGDEQEHQEMGKNRELLKWLGLGRKERKIYMQGPIVPVGGSNPDYRWASNPGWSHQPVLKV
jgi:hypothetical protein